MLCELELTVYVFANSFLCQEQNACLLTRCVQ